MKRKALKVRSSEDGKTIFCIDQANMDTLLGYFERSDKHKKKFQYIVNIILNRLRNTDVYDKEEISAKCKGVTAMKFFKGNSNDRVYCKEQTMGDRTFVIVAVELFEKKKSQHLSPKAKNLIEKVATYEYEIIEYDEEQSK